MSSTEMKSYLSLIPISAKVRRRQNRMTILLHRPCGVSGHGGVQSWQIWRFGWKPQTS